MAGTLWRPSQINVYETTLATTIDSTASIIELASPVSGLTIPGVVIMEPEDEDGVVNTTVREFISFSTINNQQISGLSRGLGGSTAQNHGAGILIHVGPGISHWNDMVDFVGTEHTVDGTHVIGTTTVNLMQTIRAANTSQATIASGYLQISHLSGGLMSTVTITQSINASLASVVGFPDPEPGGLPLAGITGPVNAGTNVPPLMIIENSVTLKSISAMLKSPVSSSSLVLDVNNNFSSLFEAGTRPSILGGGTYISTASLNSTSLSPGNIISFDVDNGGGSDLTVVLES